MPRLLRVWVCIRLLGAVMSPRLVRVSLRLSRRLAPALSSPRAVLLRRLALRVRLVCALSKAWLVKVPLVVKWSAPLTLMWPLWV